MEKVRIRLSDNRYVEGELLEKSNDIFDTLKYYTSPYYGVVLPSGNVICAKENEIEKIK
jgi:hypothetical protein